MTDIDFDERLRMISLKLQEYKKRNICIDELIDEEKYEEMKHRINKLKIYNSSVVLDDLHSLDLKIKTLKLANQENCNQENLEDFIKKQTQNFIEMLQIAEESHNEMIEAINLKLDRSLEFVNQKLKAIKPQKKIDFTDEMLLIEIVEKELLKENENFENLLVNLTKNFKEKVNSLQNSFLKLQNRKNLIQENINQNLSKMSEEIDDSLKTLKSNRMSAENEILGVIDEIFRAINEFND